MIESIFRQVRLAVRLLWIRPAFTIIAIATLALAMGAGTAVFTAVNAILLRPLPFGNPDQIVAVNSTNQDATGKVEDYGASINDYLDWAERNQVFQSLAAMDQMQISITGLVQPQQVDIGRVTANFFSTFDVQPVLGRFFLPQEQTNSSNVVILSYGLWQQFFAGDSNVVGKTIQLDGVPYSVIGVAPPSFYYAAPSQLWLPENLNVDRVIRTTSANLAVVGRLKAGVSVGQAGAAMTSIASQLAKEYPVSNAGWGARVRPVREQIVNDARPTLLMLMTAVGFLVLIAAANVATLILARSVEREPELALRVALGADRKSLFLQLLTENLILSLCGGAIGLLLAIWFLKPILMLSPLSASAYTKVSMLEKVTIDYRVIFFSFGLSVVTGFFFGMLSSLRQSTKDPGIVLKENGRGSSAGLSYRRVLSILVIAEISLVFVLLIGSAITIRGLLNLEKVHPGFRVDHVLVSKITLPATRYDHEARTAFVEKMREKLSTLHGVSSVAVTNRLPLNEFSLTTIFEVEGRRLPTPGQGLISNFRRISPDYFKTIGTRLLEGRDFESWDKTSLPVAIVSKEMAHRYWPGESAIGKRIRRFSRADAVWRTVVGVVDDVADTNLTEPPGATLYIPFSQNSFQTIQLVVRSSTDPASLTDGVRESVKALDKDIPVYDVTTMEELFAESLMKPRFVSVLLTSFAALGFLIAAFAVYGVISFSLAQRTQEIGIRMALGAQRTSVINLILRQASIPVLIGLAIGLGISFALTKLGSDLIPGIPNMDYHFVWIVPAGLMLASFLAIIVPASRATRIDPVIALRCE
jgi:putative ABC transport system permease protein